MMSDNFPQAAVADLLSSVAISTAVTPATSTTRAVATMNAIKAHILRNNLNPGDPLPTEAVLEEELGVSRSSVREALRRLEALDIVKVKQGSGSFVGEMSLEPMVETLVLRASLSAEGNRKFLREVAETRRTLDIGAAATIVAALKGSRNEELHQIVDSMVAAAERDGQFMAQDVAFHEALFRSSPHQLIRQIYSSLWLVHTSIVPNLDTVVEGSAVRTARAHLDMLEAAEAGDLAAYLAAVDDHYAPLLESLGNGTSEP